MVDHEIDGNERVDLLRVAAQSRHCVAHRGKVHDGRTPVKSCISTRAGRKPISLVEDFVRAQALMASISAFFTVRASSIAQQVLQKHLQRIGQARDIFQSRLFRFARL